MSARCVGYKIQKKSLHVGKLNDAKLSRLKWQNKTRTGDASTQLFQSIFTAITE